MPKHYERPIGAHALTLVGYDDKTEQFKFANSWGPHWGDKGFGYLPYDYVANNNVTNRWIHTHSNELWGIDLTYSA